MPVLLSTLDAFLATRAAASDDAWAEYERTSPEVFEAYHRGWGTPGRGRQWSANVEPDRDVLRERDTRARELVESLERDLRARGWSDGDLPTVLLVGSGSSNGWVTTYRGAPTLFLALELLPDPPHDEVLVAHEAVHVLHARAGADAWPDDVATTLFSEGLAVAASRVLHPGRTESSYLWFDDAHTGWARECAEHEQALRSYVAEHAADKNEDVARALFALSGRAAWPARAGYWLGDRALGGHDPSSLLDRGYGEALAWCRALGSG